MNDVDILRNYKLHIRMVYYDYKYNAQRNSKI